MDLMLLGSEISTNSLSELLTVYTVVPASGGGPERSRAEEDGRGVERKEKRSRAKEEEKETLSYRTNCRCSR